MITFDSETCGLYGMPVLIQYAVNDDDVLLHDIWLRPVQETLDLIKFFCNYPKGVCGFNLAFDWFHLCKTYTIFDLLDDKTKTPLDCLEEIAEKEILGTKGPCLKPQTACDLMLHAQKGPYQSTLDRKDIRIKKVPKQLAQKLADYLNDNLKINPIYFARSSDPYRPWRVNEFKDKETGIVDDDFKDVVLKFRPSSALKALYSDIFNIPFAEVVKFNDVEVPKNLRPTELGYAPFALAVENIVDSSGKRTWRNSWPGLIKFHIKHWRDNFLARKYAEDDVIYTRKLYYHFNQPAFGDDDSILACAVAANRWRGFKVDIPELKKLRQESIDLMEKVPIAGKRCRDFIFDVLDDDEKILVHNSTSKVVLEKMSTWVKDCECEGYIPDCKLCGGKGTVQHPVAPRAAKVKKARAAKKEIELFDKIIKAGRLYASFKVIGTLSGRMAGSDKINPQAIKGTKVVRRCFPLADVDDDMQLIGGDFEAFEVVIAVASYKDKALEADLETYGLCPDCLGSKKKLIKDPLCAGKGCGKCHNGFIPSAEDCKSCNATGQTKKKIHGLFGETLYGKTYDEIVLTKGSAEDLYYQSKRGVFSQMYGGNEHTLMERLGLDEATATTASRHWAKRYPGVAQAQQTTINDFETMQQIGGLGSRITWKEPVEYVESLLGFRRYFTLENDVCRWLFKLAETPPKEWTNIKLNVMRRDRLQTAAGAVRSAIFAAGFMIQGNNTRAAINHRIQATGAEICKNTQRVIWDNQPCGIQPWYVQVFNVHDEIMAPCKRSIIDKVTKSVKTNVEKYKPIVPLISIDWSTELETWADK